MNRDFDSDPYFFNNFRLNIEKGLSWNIQTGILKMRGG